MRPGFRKVLLVGVGLLLAGLVESAGCSNQGEGERCTYHASTDNSVNGTDDCQDGLVCTPSGQLVGGANGVDRCCPPTCSLATTYICSCVVSGTDGGFVRDGETESSPDGAETSTTDAPVETSSDAGDGATEASDGATDGASEGASDAPVDTAGQ